MLAADFCCNLWFCVLGGATCQNNAHHDHATSKPSLHCLMQLQTTFTMVLQVWNEESEQEECLAMVVRTGKALLGIHAFQGIVDSAVCKAVAVIRSRSSFTFLILADACP